MKNMVFFGLILVLFLNVSFVNARCVGLIEGPDQRFCWKYSANLRSFQEAEANCTSLNGHLASIGDALENQFIFDTIYGINMDGSKLWTGGGRIGGNGWKWTDSSPLNYTNWAEGNPNNNGDCVSFGSGDGLWFSDDCSSELAYLCKIPSSVQRYGCDSGWTYYSNTRSCYNVLHNLNWRDSENQCNSFNAHLTSIHSNDENNFIINLTKSGISGLTNSNTGVWIGLYAIVKKNKYGWTDGTPLDYTKWGAGEPDGYGQDGSRVVANCGDIHPDLVKTHETLYQAWDDDVCTVHMRASVCKKPAYPYY